MFIQRLISNSLFTILKTIFGVLVGILIARLLADPIALGQLHLAQSYLSVCLVVFGFGINGALVRYAQDEIDKGTLEQFMSQCYSVVVFVQFLVVFSLLGYSFLSGTSILSNVNQTLVVYCCFSLFFQTIQVWICSTFWGLNDFHTRGALLAMVPALKSVLLGGALLIRETQSLSEIAIHLGIAEFLSSAFFLFVFKSKLGFIAFWPLHRPKFNSAKFRRAFSFGFWSMFAAIGMLLMTLIDRASLNHFTTPTILGQYSLLSVLVSYLFLGVNVVSNVALSNYLELWKTAPHAVVRQINRLFNVLAFLLTIGSVLLYNYTDLIISAVYGSEYVGLTELVPTMLYAVIFSTYYSIMGSLTAIAEKPQITTYSFLGGLISNIIGNVVFTPLYGAYAVAMSTFVSFAVISIVLSILLSKHISQFSWRPLFVSGLAVLALNLLVHG